MNPNVLCKRQTVYYSLVWIYIEPNHNILVDNSVYLYTVYNYNNCLTVQTFCLFPPNMRIMFPFVTTDDVSVVTILHQFYRMAHICKCPSYLFSAFHPSSASSLFVFWRCLPCGGWRRRRERHISFSITQPEHWHIKRFFFYLVATLPCSETGQVIKFRERVVSGKRLCFALPASEISEQRGVYRLELALVRSRHRLIAVEWSVSPWFVTYFIISITPPSVVIANVSPCFCTDPCRKFVFTLGFGGRGGGGLGG